MYHRFKAIRSNDTITESPFPRFYSFWDYGMAVIGWRYPQFDPAESSADHF